jgi:hypothetical protein
LPNNVAQIVIALYGMPGTHHVLPLFQQVRYASPARTVRLGPVSTVQYSISPVYPSRLVRQPRPYGTLHPGHISTVIPPVRYASPARTVHPFARTVRPLACTRDDSIVDRNFDHVDQLPLCQGRFTRAGVPAHMTCTLSVFAL